MFGFGAWPRSGLTNSGSGQRSQSSLPEAKKKTKYVLGLGTLVLMAALVLVLATSNPRSALAESGENLKLISVSGQAEIRVKPDVAIVSFGVETNAPTAQEAQAANTALMTKVVSSLQESGISKEDIQTSNFSLYPVYEWEGEKPNPRQVLAGYRCNNTVTARIKDLARVGDIIDGAVKSGATNVGGISFGLLSPEAFQSQVLAQAVKDARTKAEIMASAAGVSITGIQKISDGYVSVDEGRMMALPKLADAAGSTPIESGSVVVRASVRIDFTF